MFDKANFEEAYQYIIKFVAEKSGNVFSQKNRSMVESRISKRVISLNFKSIDEYLHYLKNSGFEEKKYLVGLLTTHYTYFFREFIHFDFLEKNLAEIVKEKKSRDENTIQIFSAACSMGQEVYSLGCFMEYHLKKIDPNMKFEIIGMDIDAESIKYAEKGVYQYTEVKQIPKKYLDGNWQRGKNANNNIVKIHPKIKRNCSFVIGNLLDDDPNKKEKFDIIFCRNTLIYFDLFNSKKIVGNLEGYLGPLGLLFTGVSEPVGEYNKTLKKIGACIYQRAISKPENIALSAVKEKDIRVVLVDDSISVLKILEKMFSYNNRFKIVGKCKNGAELAEFLQENDVDAVTLDLHMPVMDGISYLENKYNPDHPPVIVVSSINKDDKTLGSRAIELGAIDYVEKPNLNNLHEAEVEICTKIQVAVKERLNRTEKKSEVTQIGIRAQKNILKIDLFLFVNSTDIKNLKRFVHELYDLGYFPKAIIVNRDTTWVESELASFDFSFSSAIKREDKEILLVNIDDFLRKHRANLYYENQILCFFEGSNFGDFIPPKFTYKNYILAESKFNKDLEHFKVMPSLSWAFHVVEKVKEFMLLRNKFIAVQRIPHQGQIVFPNEILLGVYHNGQLLGVIIAREFRGEIKSLIGTEECYEIRIVGNQLLTTSIQSAIPSNYHVSKIVVRDCEYRFAISSKKIILGKRKVSFEVKSQVNIFEEERKGNTKKILIVDDSLVFGKILRNIIDKSDYKCCGIVSDPSTLEEEISSLDPDVITLDVNMPQMSGYETYEKIISKHKIPTIVISSSLAESDDVLNLLSLGAIDYLQKPTQGELRDGNFPLIEKIDIAFKANLNTVRRSTSSFRISSNRVAENALITIGSSTGGTNAIVDLLNTFPENFPPVVIAQHIPEKFSKSFAQHLNKNFLFTIKEAEDGEILVAGQVYIAPGGKNIEVIQRGQKLIVKIIEPPTYQNFIPNVDELFYSASRLRKINIISVLLTGMGKDGAEGMGRVKENGGFTIAQNEETSVVFGMPKVAIEKGHAMEVKAIYDISKTVFDHLTLVNSKIEKAS